MERNQLVQELFLAINVQEEPDEANSRNSKYDPKGNQFNFDKENYLLFTLERWETYSHDGLLSQSSLNLLTKSLH